MTLDEALAPFGGSSLSFLATEATFKVAPDAPSIRPITSIAQAVGAFGGDVEAATDQSLRPAAERALWILQGLDVGADVFSVLSGLASAVRLYLAKHQAKRPEPGELDVYDTRQAEDAVAKLLAISWSVSRLFPGSPQEQVAAFLSLQGGRACMAWFVTIELALPFVDEVAAGGGEWLDQVIERVRDTGAERLAKAIGDAEVDKAWEVEALLRPHLHEIVAANERRMATLVAQLQKRVPVLVEVGSELGGAFGGGVDALPVYHLLGARLVAEACAKGVVREDLPEEPDEAEPPEEESEAEPMVDPARDLALKPQRTFVGRAMATSTLGQSADTARHLESEEPTATAGVDTAEPTQPADVVAAPLGPEATSAPPSSPQSTDSAPASTPPTPPTPPAPPKPAAPKAAPPKPAAPKAAPPKPVAPKAAPPKPVAPKVAPPKPAAPKPKPQPRSKPKAKRRKAKSKGGLGKALGIIGCLLVLGCGGTFAVTGGAGFVVALTASQEKPKRIIIVEDPTQKRKR